VDKLCACEERRNNVITIIGLILFILGFSLSIWAKTVMRSSWGLPATLNTSRQSRNPIYVGLLLTSVGYFLTLRSPLLITMLPVFIYFYWAMLSEEKLLLAVFGEKYKEYLSTTPRFLFF